MPRTIPLTEEQAQEKGKTFVQLIEGDIQDRSDAIKQRAYIRNVYYGQKQRATKDAGESNQHLHLLTEKIETIVTKEWNAFMATEPHSHAKRVPIEFDPEETAANEKMTNWAVDNDVPNFSMTLESWLRNRHLDGVAAVKAWYNKAERNTVIIEEAGTQWKQGDIDLTGAQVPQERLKLPLEVILSKFADAVVTSASRGKKDIDVAEEQPLEGITAYIDFVEDGRQFTNIRVEFHPSEFVDTIELYIFRPILYKDNVEIELIEFEDLVVPYRARDLQCAERVAQKYWLTYEEIASKAMSGEWNLTDKDLELLKAHSTLREDDSTPEDTQVLENQKDRVTGIHSSQQTPVRKRTKGSDDAEKLEPYRSDKILCFEVYARDDLDSDGIWEEVIYQIPYALEKIVSADYLEAVFPHGQRPFPALHSIPISNRFYGWSLGAILAPINIEVNTVINSVNRSQELINNPFGFYVPTAMPNDPKGVMSIEPGQLIPVAEKGAIEFPAFPQRPLADLQSGLDPILLFADRVSVSPQAGGSSQVRNAPRTARGTLALLSEAGAKVDKFIQAAQTSGWGQLMYQIWALYDQYASDEKWEAVTGRPRQKRQKSVDLMNQIKFVFKGNTVNTNKEVMRTIAQLRYTVAGADPLYAADPLARRELLKDFLSHFSEGVDVEKLLPKVSQFGAQRQPMDQRTETQIMLQGMPVDVLPIDDDASHIQALEQFQRSAQFDELTDTQVTLLAFHLRQHRDQLMMKQRQQALQEGAVGQGNNAPVGAQLGDIEGGIQ